MVDPGFPSDNMAAPCCLYLCWLIGEIIQQPRYYEYIARLRLPGSKAHIWDLPFYRLGLDR